jgi:hypothetical protein
MLPFPMASQSQPPIHQPRSRPPHSRPPFRFVPSVALASSIQPFYNQPLPYTYVSRSACKPRKISNVRILSVAKGVYPYCKQTPEQRVCASSVNPRLFSNLQPLSASLPSFSSPRPLFSATYSLFSESTRVGVVRDCGLLESAVSHWSGYRLRGFVCARCGAASERYGSLKLPGREVL